MKNKIRNSICGLSMMLLSFLLIFSFPAMKTNANTASAVTVGAINYEELTIQIFNNNNKTVYYSLDDNNWIEVESFYHTTTNSYTMDISWIPVKNDVMLYFKGDLVNTVNSVLLPAQDTSFQANYNKVQGTFTFMNADDADSFEWRKTSNYNWNKVTLEDNTASYKTFLSTIESLRYQGSKIIIRIPQVIGTASNAGSRPSNEVTITITARASEPKIVVNSSKLTINTTNAMEYYSASAATWIECSKNMKLSEITPKVLYENGANEVTLMVRFAATTRASYSKTAYLTIKGQRSAPEIGDNSKDVTYYYANSKLVMAFNKASLTNVYEYTIVKTGGSFDLSTAKWTAVSSTRLMTLSIATAPNGCTVYVRKKGIDTSTVKNIELLLSSAIGSFRVSY